MKTSQNFRNHARYYPFHHFILTPLTLVFLGWSFFRIDFTSLDTMWDGLYFVLGALILALLPLLARIYALKLQNRHILNEMRFRYYLLTGKSFSEMEEKLRLSQIIALRFASDQELLPLMDQAIQQKLSPKSIKKSVQTWKGDYGRV